MRQNSSIPAAPPDTPGCSWSGLELGLGQISDTSGSNNMLPLRVPPRRIVRKYLRAKCFDTNSYMMLNVPRCTFILKPIQRGKHTGIRGVGGDDDPEGGPQTRKTKTDCCKNKKTHVMKQIL